MSIKPCLTAVAGLMLLTLATPAAAQEIRPGLWEIKHDMQIPGQPDLSTQMAQMQAMMKEQLKNMPAEQRRMMEQRMGARMADNGATRICLTPEDVKAGIVREGHRQGQCTFTKVQRTGKTWQAHMQCTEPPGEGDFKVTVHGPTHYSSEGVLTNKEHGRMVMKTEARHVSSDCGNVPSVREMSKRMEAPGAAR